MSSTIGSLSMKNDLIVAAEDSFMEGASPSFPASDPPSYMAGRRDHRARRSRKCRRGSLAALDSPFACHATEITEK